MRIAIAAIVGLVCLLAKAGLADENAEFKPFSPKENSFKISFPGKPAESTITTSTESGPVVMHELTVKRPNEKESFALIYSDLPPEMLKLANPETLLNRACNGGANSVQGKPGDQTKIELDGHPGRELEVAGLGGTRLWRLYLVGGRLYQLLVTTETGKPSAERAKAFFNSFQLTKSSSTSLAQPSATEVRKQ